MSKNREAKQLASELAEEIKSLAEPNAANLRKAFHTFTAKLKDVGPEFVAHLRHIGSQFGPHGRHIGFQFIPHGHHVGANTLDVGLEFVMHPVRELEQGFGDLLHASNFAFEMGHAIFDVGRTHGFVLYGI